MDLREYEALSAKFNNKKTTVGGIVFDSKMEADYYIHLRELQKEGLVIDIELQPTYLLVPAFKKLGRTVRKMEYKADFLVTYSDGTQQLVDVKGMVTEVFKLKAKLFDDRFRDLELHVITQHKNEWILLKDKPKKVGLGSHGRTKKRVVPRKRKR